MINLNNKRFLLSLITFLGINAFATDIEMNKDFYELDIQSNRMIVIDFPFTITEKQFLGNKDNVDGDFQDKSLYIRLTDGSVDVSVWGGEKPILMTLNAKPNGARRLSFMNTKGDISNLKKENKEWNHDIRVAEEIEAYSKTGAVSGYEKKTLEQEFDLDIGLSAYKIEKIFKQSYAFEKIQLLNTTNRTIDLFEKRSLYFTDRDEYIIDAVSFNERYLLPGQKTICYLGLEKKGN